MQRTHLNPGPDHTFFEFPESNNQNSAHSPGSNHPDERVNQNGLKVLQGIHAERIPQPYAGIPSSALRTSLNPNPSFDTVQIIEKLLEKLFPVKPISHIPIKPISHIIMEYMDDIDSGNVKEIKEELAEKGLLEKVNAWIENKGEIHWKTNYSISPRTFKCYDIELEKPLLKEWKSNWIFDEDGFERIADIISAVLLTTSIDEIEIDEIVYHKKIESLDKVLNSKYRSKKLNSIAEKVKGVVKFMFRKNFFRNSTFNQQSTNISSMWELAVDAFMFDKNALSLRIICHISPEVMGHKNPLITPGLYCEMANLVKKQAKENSYEGEIDERFEPFIKILVNSAEETRPGFGDSDGDNATDNSEWSAEEWE